MLPTFPPPFTPPQNNRALKTWIWPSTEHSRETKNTFARLKKRNVASVVLFIILCCLSFVEAHHKWTTLKEDPTESTPRLHHTRRLLSPRLPTTTCHLVSLLTVHPPPKDAVITENKVTGVFAQVKVTSAAGVRESRLLIGRWRQLRERKKNWKLLPLKKIKYYLLNLHFL